MGVEGRANRLSRQNSDDIVQSSVPAASSELRLRRSNSPRNADGDQDKSVVQAAAALAKGSDGNDQAVEGLGLGEAAQSSWFQRVDDTFLSPLFRISAVERERQNYIVSSFQSECAFTATGHQGSASAFPPVQTWCDTWPGSLRCVMSRWMWRWRACNVLRALVQYVCAQHATSASIL